MALFVVWPDGHGMVYGMAWRAWHSIWYGLKMHGIAWFMVWPCGPRMLYSMAWRASHGIKVWPGGPDL